MIDKLIKEFDALITKHTNKIVSGRIADFSEYRYELGRVQGIMEAKQAFIELIKKGEEDNEHV